MNLPALLALFLIKRVLNRSNRPQVKPSKAKTSARPGKRKPAAKRSQNAQGTKRYLNRLAKLESGPDQPNYTARRPNSQYWGRWQLGRLARNGPPNEPASEWVARRVPWRQFSQDAALQTAAVTNWARRAYRELKRQPDARAAVAAGTLHGLPVTWSGLVGFDHLVGRAAVLKWIRTGADTQDANGTPGTRYLTTLNGADLSAWNPKPSKGKTNV